MQILRAIFLRVGTLPPDPLPLHGHPHPRPGRRSLSRKKAGEV